MTAEQEREIIQAVLGGDTEAFGSLVTEYSQKVYTTALRMVKKPEDAEDIAQDAFLKAYTSLGSFKGQSRFSTWIISIVINLCRDYLRRPANAPTVPLAAEDDEGKETELQIEDEKADIEETVERRETVMAVREAVAGLSDEHRAVIIMADLNDMPYSDIADALGIPINTVRSRLHRARKELAEKLRDSGTYSESAASKIMERR